MDGLAAHLPAKQKLSEKSKCVNKSVSNSFYERENNLKFSITKFNGFKIFQKFQFSASFGEN